MAHIGWPNSSGGLQGGRAGGRLHVVRVVCGCPLTIGFTAEILIAGIDDIIGERPHCQLAPSMALAPAALGAWGGSDYPLYPGRGTTTKSIYYAPSLEVSGAASRHGLWQGN